MKKTLLLLCFALFFIFNLEIFPQHYKWTDTKLSNFSLSWSTTSMSPDGMKMIAGTNRTDLHPGKLYLSSDAGNTWKETQPGGYKYLPWCISAMDSAGSKIIAGIAELDSGRLYLSTDFGSSWSLIQPAELTSIDYNRAAISADGSLIIASFAKAGLITVSTGEKKTSNISADGGGRLYISSNGYYWIETQPAGNTDQHWQSISINANGSKAIAAAAPGRLYISTDGYPDQWKEVKPAGDYNCYWDKTAISSDGSRMIAGIDYGSLYVSSDGGESWIETKPSGNTPVAWTTIAMSSDGLRIMAVCSSGKLYISNDGGNSWNEIQPVDYTEGWGESASMNFDGTIILACSSFYGKLYVGQLDSTSLSITVSPALAGSNLLVGKTQKITWVSRNISSVKLQYTTDNGTSWLNIVSSIPADSGYYSWIVPNTPSSNCKIRITNIDDSTLYSITTGLFSISTAGLEIILPDSIAAWEKGSKHCITWINKYIENIDIKYTTDDGKSWVPVISQIPASSESYLWTVPDTLSSQCRIKILSSFDTTITSTSNKFSIIKSFKWIKTEPNNNENNLWLTSSISSDGMKMIAGANGGRLYLSSNAGITWEETRPGGNNNMNWYVSAMDSDASKIITGTAGGGSGLLFLSNDFGSSWTSIWPAGYKTMNWSCIAISADGSKIVAGTGPNGRLYISNDSGSTWKETQPAGNFDDFWQTCSINSDGSKIIAGSRYEKLYMSYNGGNTWTEVKPPVNLKLGWIKTAMSYDGSKVIAGVYWGRLYISTDSGKSWTETQPAGNHYMNWYSTSMSSDGKKVIAGLENGNLYVSNDGGLNWTETQPGEYFSGVWTTTSMNYNGTITIAGSNNAGLYLHNEVVADIKDKHELPKAFSLSQNYPNPFNPVTTINYQLPKEGQVTLKVYDILGREVAALVNEFKQAGYYKAEFNASTLSSGVYIYRLTVDNFISTKKLILMK